MAVRYYSSVAPPTTLSGSINAGAASITVGSTTGFPALTPYTLSLSYDTIGEELVQVNSVGGTTLSVTRGIDGTSATSHNAGVEVRHVTSARDFADSRTHEESDGGVHGLGPGEELVGTTKVQTLSNKTLDMATGTLSRVNIFNDANWTTTITGDAGFPGSNLLELKASPSGATALTVGTGGILRVYNNVTNDASPSNLKFRLIRSDGTTDIVTIAAGGSISTRLTDGTDGVVVQGSPDNARRRAYQVRDLDGSTIRSALYTDGTAFLSSKVAAQPTLDIRTATAQTARALRIQNSSATEVAFITPAGTVQGSNLVAETAVTSPAFNFEGTSLTAKPVLRGITPVSFTGQTSFTVNVNFPASFTATPSVTTNIASGAGNTTRWGSRAYNVTTTGFTLFVFRGDATDGPETWSNIPVHWIATQ